MIFPKLSVLGIGVSRVSYDSVSGAVLACAKAGTPLTVTALAVHGVMEGYGDKKIAEVLNSIDIVTPDGQPLKWALNLLGANEIRERVCGPDLMLKICEKAALEGVPVFFYGSRQNVLDGLKHNLVVRYPRLIVAGMRPDRFRDSTSEEDRRDIDEINTSGARIVFVGRGCPRQEIWVAAHRNSVCAVMIAVGAAFDFHAGLLKRPHMFIQNIGLEWLFRLSQEPARLWRRYLILNPLFMYNFTMQLLGLKKYDR